MILRIFKHSKLAIVALLLISTVATASANNNLTISGLSVDKTVLNKAEDVVNFQYHINQKAHVELKLFDAQNHLIQSIKSNNPLEAGDHQVQWDGNDLNGKPVSPEVYHYVLEAHVEESEAVVLDLTDQTGGESIVIEKVSYDPEKQLVSYYVPKPARVFLRAGIENGFVVHTIINNAIRLPGYYEEHWDGMDSNQVLSLKLHPKLQFYGEGYQLSKNSIVKEDKSNLVSRPEWKHGKHTVTEKRLVSKRPKGLNRLCLSPRGIL